MRKVRYAAGRLSELTIDVAKTVPLTKEVETEANRSGSSSDGGECTLVLTGGKVYAVGSLCPHQNAPLDGANVEKFTNLIKEFSERSQFLLITHNPVTMEAAPTWYGVTMKEAGVSSILSYRVPQLATMTESDQAVVLARPPTETPQFLTALVGAE